MASAPDGTAAAEAAGGANSEADLAIDAGHKAANNAKDTARLIDTEQRRLRAHLSVKAKGFLPPGLSADDGATNYLIASFPKLRCVNYVRLPDLVWRPLVVSGVGAPAALVVDEERARLYIADGAVAKIVWYQLLSLPSGALITGGRQNVAVQAMGTRNLALDLAGNLWFSGKSLPPPPVPSTDAIWKQPWMTIDQSSISGTPIDPLPQWTNGHTQSTVSPLVLDAFNIYYGNDVEGKTKGSLVKASQSVPLADPKSGLSAMADNAEVTYSVAVTPTSLFYATDNAIYGVMKTKVGASCGATGSLCHVVTDLVKKPTSMLWDGDGTIYVADNGAGAIYSFASGSVSEHALDKIIDAGGVWGLDVFKVMKNQSLRAGVSLLALITFFFSAVTAVAQ